MAKIVSVLTPFSEQNIRTALGSIKAHYKGETRKKITDKPSSENLQKIQSKLQRILEEINIIVNKPQK